MLYWLLLLPPLILATACKPNATEHIDVSVRQISHVPMEKARDVTFLGTTAFVSQGLSGLTTVDIANPARPRIRRQFLPSELQPLSMTPLRDDIMLAGDRFRGLLALDVSNQDHPTTVGQLMLPSAPYQVVVFYDHSRTFAALPCGGDGVVIADVTDPANMKTCGQMKTDADFSRRLAVSGKTLFLADNAAGGIKAIDVSNPASPRLTLKVALPGFFDSIMVHGDTVLAGCRQYGVRVFRWTNMSDSYSTPSLQHLCDSYRIDDRVRNTATLGDLLVVADDLAGVTLYDFRRPQQPLFVGQFRHEGMSAMTCEVRDGLIYAPSWDGGLFILKPEVRRSN